MHFDFAQRFEGMSGSAIRAIFALLKDPEIISFGGGNPAGEAFPGEELSEIAERLLKNNFASVLQYGQTEGYLPLREQIAEEYGVVTDMVQITVGAQQAIDLVAKAMLNKGDCILVENPTFLGALQTFKLYQPKIKAVETDENGIIIEDLEEKIKQHKPKLLYIIPNFQNPTGITTSLERRKAISEIAQKYNLLIIEDDPYGKLRYEGDAVESIFEINKSGNVIYLTSFSKTISPGLRIGAAIGDKELIAKMVVGAQGQTVHPPVLNQAMIYEYVKSGAYLPHIEAMCKLYKSRRNTMLAELEKGMPKGVSHTNPQGGLFLWCSLPEGVNATELFKKAVESKVAFVPGDTFYCENVRTNKLRLNFSFTDEEKIKKGISTLAKVTEEFIGR
ncbi:MAG: PLP-dependent aminotransferase family protein [Clostridia bacterium]|nr:PLP-dependent aminotransferase family protein [Clostridia bacterium]